MPHPYVNDGLDVVSDPHIRQIMRSFNTRIETIWSQGEPYFVIVVDENDPDDPGSDYRRTYPIDPLFVKYFQDGFAAELYDAATIAKPWRRCCPIESDLVCQHTAESWSQAILEAAGLWECESHVDYCECSRCEERDDAEDVKFRGEPQHHDGKPVGPDFDRIDSCTFARTIYGKGKLLHLKLSCRRWKCDACRRRILIPQWLENLQEKFNGAKKIFRGEVCADEYEAAYKSIRRHGGNFVRIKQADGSLVVFADMDFLGANVLSVAEAKKRIAVDMNAIVVLRRPISTSRPWKLPPRVKSEFEVVSRSSVFRPDDYAEAALKHGLVPQRICTSTFGRYSAVTDGLTVECSREQAESIVSEAERAPLVRITLLREKLLQSNSDKSISMLSESHTRPVPT